MVFHKTENQNDILYMTTSVDSGSSWSYILITHTGAEKQMTLQKAKCKQRESTLGQGDLYT